MKEKTEQELDKIGYLPTKEFPSDHMNVGATFILSNYKQLNYLENSDDVVENKYIDKLNEIENQKEEEKKQKKNKN